MGKCNRGYESGRKQKGHEDTSPCVRIAWLVVTHAGAASLLIFCFYISTDDRHNLKEHEYTSAQDASHPSAIQTRICQLNSVAFASAGSAVIQRAPCTTWSSPIACDISWTGLLERLLST